MVLSGRRMLVTLLLTFTSYGLVDVSAATTCGKGTQVTRRGDGCEECPDYTYRPDSHTFKKCEHCTNCDKDSWSEVSLNCTKDSNTICRCPPGFVAREKNFASCKCDRGSGLVSIGGKQECQECKDGFFTDDKDKRCGKWRECQMSGVKVNGTKTSDVICNDELDKTRSTTHYTTHPPTRQAPNHGSPRRSTAAFVSALVSTSRNKGPFPSGKTESSSGMSTLLIGIVGLLLLVTLATVTCKLMVIPCIQSDTRPVVKTRDSVCGRPVEESGDSSSALVKGSPGEP